MRTTPSIVAFSDDGERPCRPARQAPGCHQSRADLLRRLKRLVGPAATMIRWFEKDKKLVPYKIVKASKRRCLGRSRRQGPTRPRRSSAFILQKMKEDRGSPSRPEGRSGRHHRFPPISTTRNVRPPRMPARSPALKCCASSTSRTAAAAGLRSRQVEVRHHRGVRPRRRHLRRVDPWRSATGVFEVKSTNGDTFPLAAKTSTCGSSAIWPMNSRKSRVINLRNDKLALQRLKRGPPEKRPRSKLSSTTQTEINLPFITADQTGPKHLTMKLTARPSSRRWSMNLVQKTIEPCRKALKDAGPHRR